MVEPTNTNGSASPRAERKKLIEVNNLVKYFPVRAGLMQRVKAWVKAVDDVSFFINEGETFGLVGESGCGKTTVGRTILRLIPHTSGEVLFNGQNVFDLDSGDLKKMRRDMQIIFQDPYSSLDPRLPIGESISEGLRVHTDKSGQELSLIHIWTNQTKPYYASETCVCTSRRAEAPFRRSMASISICARTRPPSSSASQAAAKARWPKPSCGCCRATPEPMTGRFGCMTRTSWPSPQRVSAARFDGGASRWCPRRP